jgi:hypothetical protein
MFGMVSRKIKFAAYKEHTSKPQCWKSMEFVLLSFKQMWRGKIDLVGHSIAVRGLAPSRSVSSYAFLSILEFEQQEGSKGRGKADFLPFRKVRSLSLSAGDMHGPLAARAGEVRCSFLVPSPGTLRSYVTGSRELLLSVRLCEVWERV